MIGLEKITEIVKEKHLKSLEFKILGIENTAEQGQAQYHVLTEIDKQEIKYTVDFQEIEAKLTVDENILRYRNRLAEMELQLAYMELKIAKHETKEAALAAHLNTLLSDPKTS